MGGPSILLAALAIGCAALFGCPACAFAESAQGKLSEITFADYSPISSNVELARRLLSPLKNAKLQKMLAAGLRLSNQPINLSQEKFALYVPPHMPRAGYGLIVYVSPWNVARLPDGWGPVLDENGMILVTAAKSGNGQGALARREPLALLAETNVAQRYRLDPAHIYIAGFSGGSRVSQRVALGYPDIFRGAILNSGSDPIGNTTVPLPPRDLFAQFRTRSHLVFLTGDQDADVIATDTATLHSLRDWCFFRVDQRTTMGGGHDPIDAAALSRALDILAAPVDPLTAQIASCSDNIDAEMTAKLTDVQKLIAAGRRAEAKQELTDIDAHYGGLAAPLSVELAKKLDSP
jgi:hypothetical protein